MIRSITNSNVRNILIVSIFIVFIASCDGFVDQNFQEEITQDQSDNSNSDLLSKTQRDSIWNIRLNLFDSLNHRYKNTVNTNLKYLKNREISSNSIIGLQIGQSKDQAIQIIEEYCEENNFELELYEGTGSETYLTTDSIQLLFKIDKDSSYLENIASASKNICIGEICKYSSFDDVMKRLKLEDVGTGYLKVSGTKLYIVFDWNKSMSKPLRARHFYITNDPDDIAW